MQSTTPRLRLGGLESPHGGPFVIDVEPSDCVAIVGRSGSGKSVLLRLIADLDPHQGEVWLDGRARSSWSGPEWRRQVVYQAAEPAWWAATARAHFTPAVLPLAESMLPELGLDARLLDADVARLSTGERQRMALVRSLAGAPSVVLLDEPTSALDPASTEAVEALLAARVARGLTVIAVTHSRDQALRIGRCVFELRDRTIFPL